MTLIFVREKHDPELARNHIETGIRKREGSGVGGLEIDLLIRAKFSAPDSSIRGLRSVAVKRASGGNRSRNRRVTMPVPAAISSTRVRSRDRNSPGDVIGEINKEYRAKALIVKARNAACKVRGSIAHNVPLAVAGFIRSFGSSHREHRFNFLHPEQQAPPGWRRGYQ